VKTILAFRFSLAEWTRVLEQARRTKAKSDRPRDPREACEYLLDRVETHLMYISMFRSPLTSRNPLITIPRNVKNELSALLGEKCASELWELCE
jgi:hypothetical protein